MSQEGWLLHILVRLLGCATGWLSVPFLASHESIQEMLSNMLNGQYPLVYVQVQVRGSLHADWKCT